MKTVTKITGILAATALWAGAAGADAICDVYDVENTDSPGCVALPAGEPSPWPGSFTAGDSNSYTGLAKDESYGDTESDEGMTSLFWISEDGDGNLFWNLAAGAWDSFTNLLMVIKQGDVDPTTAYWYLTFGEYSGAICRDSVVGPDCTSNAEQLSHASLYGIRGTSVPEPGTLALLGLGLAGLGLGARRRRKI